MTFDPGFIWDRGGGIRAKGHKIYESDDEYQLREGQTVYGDWPDSEYENTFAWILVN